MIMTLPRPDRDLIALDKSRASYLSGRDSFTFSISIVIEHISEHVPNKLSIHEDDEETVTLLVSKVNTEGKCF